MKYWNHGYSNEYNFTRWCAISEIDDTDSLWENPLLMDTDNDNFRLKYNSPCIDSGSDLGTNYDDGLDPWRTSFDYVLNQDAYGQWEIGAYIANYTDGGG